MGVWMAGLDPASVERPQPRQKAPVRAPKPKAAPFPPRRKRSGWRRLTRFSRKASSPKPSTTRRRPRFWVDPGECAGKHTLSPDFLPRIKKPLLGNSQGREIGCVGDNKRLLWTSPRHKGNAKTARFRGTIKATSPSWIGGLVDDEGLGPPTLTV